MALETIKADMRYMRRRISGFILGSSREQAIDLLDTVIFTELRSRK
jgi:hypothetical protein